jgi:hypothetical protein
MIFASPQSGKKFNFVTSEGGCSMQSFAKVADLVRRTFWGKNKKLTRREQRERLALLEAIVDYARMERAYHNHSKEVIVEVPELARRFRETPHVIKDALTRLSKDGRAKDVKYGCWVVRPNGNLNRKFDQGAA